MSVCGSVGAGAEGGREGDRHLVRWPIAICPSCDTSTELAELVVACEGGWTECEEAVREEGRERQRDSFERCLRPATGSVALGQAGGFLGAVLATASHLLPRDFVCSARCGWCCVVFKEERDELACG